ncbi:hypothetical protein ACCI49_15520 [Microbulbifer epialgicus]|uniref:Uncharacterized protein n=1 Tax=Microbulbifer epialgicus TaxID=393907 RepID=A0ABV4P1Y6_9GAMM
MLAAFVASSVFYLGCPNQQWRQQRPLTFYTALLVSLILVVTSWFLFRLTLSTLSASFSVICFLMLALGILPFTSVLDKPGKVIARKKKRIEKGLEDYTPHWWVKSLCALLLGFPLALALAGLVAWWGPGNVLVNDKTQLVMWLITPVWLTCLSLVYLFTSVKRMLAIYLGLNLLMYSLLLIARTGG